MRLYTPCFFFFQAEDGIRDYKVTGVQTCALPIYSERASGPRKHAVSAPDDLFDHRSEEHTSELQSPCNLVCRLLLEIKKDKSERLTRGTPQFRLLHQATPRARKAVPIRRPSAGSFACLGGRYRLGFFFFLMIRRTPDSTSFPYPPSFR